MPTERFYKLPEEKKRTIRDAAVQEFLRVPFEKASINKMIQAAGISRGSFYTYFQDKRDLLGYIFEDTGERWKNTWVECLEEAHGNIWIGSELLLKTSMQYAAKKGALILLMQNVVFFQDLEKVFGQVHLIRQCHETKVASMLEELYERTDRSRFCRDDMEDFGRVVSMIVSAFMECTAWYYHHFEEEENIKKIFHEKLEILQYGICKQ